MMKKTTKFIALLSGAALLTSSAFAQGVVATAPVGYVTVTINGTGGIASEAFSYLGLPMLPAVSAQGLITASSANVITDSSASWGVDFSSDYYVQITSGDNAGASATIASNSATSLTTVEDLSSLLTGGESYTIRKYLTIADVFGADNSAGLTGGSSPAGADTILIPDATTQGFEQFYYKSSGLGGTGWRSTSNSGDQSAALIPPSQALLIKRVSSSDIDLVVAGSVQDSDSSAPIENGFNWFSSAFPVSLTLAEMFGLDGGFLTGGASPSAADEVLVPDGSGGFTLYYYKNSGLGGTGWRSTSVSGDQKDTVVSQAGSVVLINRKLGGATNLVEVKPF